MRWSNTNAYGIKRLWTEPIGPETSTGGDPIRARLIKTLVIIGLRRVGNNE